LRERDRRHTEKRFPRDKDWRWRRKAERRNGGEREREQSEWGLIRINLGPNAKMTTGAAALLACSRSRKKKMALSRGGKSIVAYLSLNETLREGGS
jgi:hypothetical protein